MADETGDPPPLKTFQEAMASMMSGVAAAAIPIGEALQAASDAAAGSFANLDKLRDAQRAILPDSYPTVLPVQWVYRDHNGDLLDQPIMGLAGPTPDRRSYRLGRLPEDFGQRAANLQQWAGFERDRQHEREVYDQWRRGSFRAALPQFPADVVEQALQAALDGKAVKLNRRINGPDQLIVEGEVLAEHDVLAAVRHLLPSG